MFAFRTIMIPILLLAGATNLFSAETRKAAIFVDNRAGKEFNDKVIVLEDFITSRVASLGFQIINREVVVNSLKTYDATAPRPAKQEVSGAELDQLLNENTSALRLAQSMGADLLLCASITTFGTETKAYEDKELGVRTLNTTLTIRASYKIVEAWAGGTVMGDVFKASKTTRQTAQTDIKNSDAVNELLDDASLKITETLSKRVAMLKDLPAKPQGVKVTIAPQMTDMANLPVTIPDIQYDAEGKPVVRGQKTTIQPLNVNVELNGLSIGSAPGAFTVPPGLHKLRLSREGFRDWVRTVNFFDNQLLEVSLQMTEAGYQRWKDNTTFLQNLEKDRKLTDAQVDAIKGFAQMLRQMGFKIDVKHESKGDALIKPQVQLFK